MNSVFCQDYIYLKDGSKLKTNIKEITKTSIVYSDYDNPDNGIKLIVLSDVKLIAYADGKTVNYEKNGKANSDEFTKNLIAYHLADLLINNFTMSYERLFRDGKMGVQIPISFGYKGDYQELGDFTSYFYTGVKLNFYPLGQKKWTYVLGPEFRIGNGNIEDYYYDPYYGDNGYINEDVNYFKFHINNGVMFTPIKNLSLATVVSLGIRFVDNKKVDEQFRTNGAVSFNMIYRF